jgi:hypothetical protein
MQEIQKEENNMPFAYFTCEVTGESITPQSCLACARQGSLPGCESIPAIIAGIVNSTEMD